MRVQVQQLATEITRDSQLLAALDDTGLEPLGATDEVEALTEDVELLDLMTLAESPPSDADWIEQTLQLLEEIDEDAPEETTGDTDEEDWLNELQLLDETELTASS